MIENDLVEALAKVQKEEKELSKKIFRKPIELISEAGYRIYSFSTVGKGHILQLYYSEFDGKTFLFEINTENDKIKVDIHYPGMYESGTEFYNLKRNIKSELLEQIFAIY